jgi:prepilin-type N-terminal cleavage/methylation domain-containing protein
MKTPIIARRRSIAASTGFSLIETLVAILIFALMMMGTIPLFVRSTSDVARNRNMMHYNNGMQALMDELTTRNSISATDALVTTGTRVYTNATCTGSAPSPCGASEPAAVNQLFSGLAAIEGTSRTLQNNLLAQVQYEVVVEGARKRVNMVVFYYTSSRFVSPVASTTPLTVAGGRALHMSSVSASGYIDTPSKIL